MIFFKKTDCWYPQSMLMRKNKKNTVYPSGPQFNSIIVPGNGGINHMVV